MSIEVEQERPGTALSDSPPPLVRFGVWAGLTKVDHQWEPWLRRRLGRPGWLRGQSSMLLAIQLVLGVQHAVLLDTLWSLLAPAGIAVVMALNPAWLQRRGRTRLERLHGIGDREAFDTSWSPKLYTVVMVSSLVIACVALTAVNLALVEPRVDAVPAGCAGDGAEPRLYAVVHNRDNRVRIFTVTFRYDGPDGEGQQTVVVSVPPRSDTLASTTAETVPVEGCPPFAVEAEATG